MMMIKAFVILLLLFVLAEHVAGYVIRPCEKEWCLVGTSDGGSATATEIRIPTGTPELFSAAKSRCQTLAANLASFSPALVNSILPSRALTAELAWSNAYVDVATGEVQSTRWTGDGTEIAHPLINTSQWGVFRAGIAKRSNNSIGVDFALFNMPNAGFSSPGCFVFNASMGWDLGVFTGDCAAATAVAVCERRTSVAWTSLNDTTLEVGIASFVATASDAKAQCQRWGGTLAAVPAGRPTSIGPTNDMSYLDFFISGATRPGPVGQTATSDVWLGYDAKTQLWDRPRTAANDLVKMLAPEGLPSTAGTDSCTFLNTTLRTIEKSDCSTTRRTVACTRYARPHQMRNATSMWCTPNNNAGSRSYLLYPPPLGTAAERHSAFLPNASRLHEACGAMWGGNSVTLFDRIEDIKWCFADYHNFTGDAAIAALLTAYDPAKRKDITGATIATSLMPLFLANLTVRENRALVANLSSAIVYNSSAQPQFWLPGICVANLAGSTASMRFVSSPHSPSNWTVVPGGYINVTMLMGRPLQHSGESFSLCFTGTAPLSVAAGGATCQTFSASAYMNPAVPMAEARSFIIKLDYAAGMALTDVEVPFQCSPASACGGATFKTPKYTVMQPLSTGFSFYGAAGYGSGSSSAGLVPLSAEELQVQRDHIRVGFPLWFDIIWSTDTSNLFSANSDGSSGADYDALVFSFSGTAGGAPNLCRVYSAAGNDAPVTSSDSPFWFKGGPSTVSHRFMLLCNTSASSAGTLAVTVQCSPQALRYSSAVTRMVCRSFPNATTVIEFANGVLDSSSSQLTWSLTHTTLGEPATEDGVAEQVMKYYAFGAGLINSLRVRVDYPNISSATAPGMQPEFLCLRIARIYGGAQERPWKQRSTCIGFINSTTSAIAAARRQAEIAAAASNSSSSPCYTCVSTALEFVMDFDPDMQLPPDGNVTVTFELYGSVAEQYGASRIRNLRFTPRKIKVTMSGLSSVIIFDAITAEVRHPIIATTEVEVPCAPAAGCGPCDNRIRDTVSRIFNGIPMTISSFASSGFASMQLYFADPVPATADSVAHLFNPSFQCTPGKYFFEFVFPFNQTVELRKPRALNVTGAPDTIYVGGPSRTFYVHTPNAFVVYGNQTAPLVNLSLTTPSGTLQVAPARVEWNVSSLYVPIQVSGLAPGASQRIDFTVISPTTPQFTAPPSIFMQVLPRATVDLRLNNPQTAYVVGAEYDCTIVISRLPLDPDEELVVTLVQNSSYFVATSLRFYANSSGTTGDISFKFVALPSLSESVTAAEYSWLNLSLSGSSVDAYYMPEDVVTRSERIGPIRKRIAMVVDCPAFALAGSTFDVAAWLSRPPITSVAVHLTIWTASSALTLQPATSSTVVLTWYAGESTSRKFNVTSNATFEGDTVLNFSTTCSGCSFKEVDDNISTAVGAAPPMLPENANSIKIAITARSLTSLKLFGPHDLILDRVTCFNVSLSKPPPERGVLIVTLQGDGMNYVSLSPPQLSLSGDAFQTTGMFCINGTKVTPAGQRANLTLKLLGKAADLFEPVAAESTIELRVNPRLNLILDLPQVLIMRNSNRRNSSFALPEALAPNVFFALHLSAPGVIFEPSKFLIFGHEPDTNATRYFIMYTSNSGVNVTLRGDIYGNATGFAPISQQLELLALGSVSVSADTAPIFRNEIAFLLITIGRAPLESSSMQATVQTNCSDAAILPWCVMSQKTVVFSRTRPTTVAIVIQLSPQHEDFPQEISVPFIVVFNSSSTAASQYSLVPQYPTAVHFVPRRRISIVQAVQTVFLGFPQTITFNVSALPDPATTLFLQTSVSSAADNNNGGNNNNNNNLTQTSETVSWNSTSGGGNARLRVLPITVRQQPENGSLQVSFVISSIPAVQQLRFVAPDPLTIRVVEKVTLKLVSPPNPTQILGPANNQSFVVALNRIPSGWLRARFVYDAVFVNMIRFSPSELLWNESDTAETLNRTCLVIGEFLGVAEAIGFRLESSAIDEVILAEPVALNLTAPLVSSLTVSGLRKVSFTGSDANLVAGLGQVKLISITVSDRPVKYPLVVRVNYTGTEGSLECNASIITFLPPKEQASSGIDNGRTQVIACTGLAPSLQAEFNVTVVDGPEYSKQIDGFVSFSILQRPLLVMRKPDDTIAAQSERFVVPSETNLTFALEIQSFEGALKPSVEVNVDLIRDQAQVFEFAVARPSGTLVFTGASLRQSVSVAIVLRRLQNFTTFLRVQFLHDKSQTYLIELFVVESIRVVVPDFPMTVTAGAWNSIRFHVNQTIVPTDERVIELRFNLAACATSDVVMSSEPLRWSRQLSSAIAVGAEGVKPGSTCRVSLRSTRSLAPADQVPVYFEGSFVVLPQPGVAVGVNGSKLSDEKIKEALYVPFKSVQKEGLTLELHAKAGQFKFVAITAAQKKAAAETVKVTDAAGNLVESPNSAANAVVNASDYFMPHTFMSRSATDQQPLPTSLEMGDTPLYIIASRTAAEAPRGIAALQATQCPNLIRVVPTTAMPNVNMPDGNASNWGATLVITPCTPLLLIESETITLVFGSRAFSGNFHPDAKLRTLQLQIGRVSADLLSANDWISVQLPAVVGMFIGAFWFPALSLQPVRIASAVLSMDCPVTEVRFIEKQVDLPKVYFLFSDYHVTTAPLSKNGGWLAVAAVNTALCILCFLLHLVFAVAGYFRSSGRVTKSFTEVCGVWHFPSASFHVIFFFAGSIVEAALRVIFLNAQVSLTTAGILLLIGPLVIVGVTLHGVVWRNHSLEYHDVSQLQVNKWFLLRAIGRTGFWTHPDKSYIARHSSLFSTFRGPFRWFLLFEYGFTLALALLSAIEPTGLRGCMARTGTMAAIYFILLGAVLLWRPYSILFHNITFAFYYLIMGACLSTILSQMDERIRNDAVERSAISLAKTASAIQLIQSVIVLILEAVRWVFGDEESNRELLAQGKDKEEALEAAELSIVHSRALALDDDDIYGYKRRAAAADKEDEEDDDEDGDGKRRIMRYKRLSQKTKDDDGEPLRSDERDTGADKALDEYLASVERNKARGLFLTGALKGNESAFSPQRKRDLDEHREAVRANVTTTLPKRPDPLKETMARREAEERERAEQAQRDAAYAPSMIKPHERMMTMGRAVPKSQLPFDFFRQRSPSQERGESGENDDDDDDDGVFVPGRRVPTGARTKEVTPEEYAMM